MSLRTFSSYKLSLQIGSILLRYINCLTAFMVLFVSFAKSCCVYSSFPFTFIYQIFGNIRKKVTICNVLLNKCIDDLEFFSKNVIFCNGLC